MAAAAKANLGPFINYFPYSSGQTRDLLTSRGIYVISQGKERVYTTCLVELLGARKLYNFTDILPRAFPID